MASGALAWARAQPMLGVMEERRGRESQRSPVNVSACGNAGAETRGKGL